MLLLEQRSRCCVDDLRNSGLTLWFSFHEAAVAEQVRVIDRRLGADRTEAARRPTEASELCRSPRRHVRCGPGG